MSNQQTDEAVRLLRALMEERFVNWRTVPEKNMIIVEQEVRKFLREMGQ